MSSQQIVINKEEILNRIRDNDPIISRILSTKTCKYEEYINNEYDSIYVNISSASMGQDKKNIK